MVRRILAVPLAALALLLLFALPPAARPAAEGGDPGISAELVPAAQVTAVEALLIASAPLLEVDDVLLEQHVRLATQMPDGVAVASRSFQMPWVLTDAGKRALFDQRERLPVPRPEYIPAPAWRMVNHRQT